MRQHRASVAAAKTTTPSCRTSSSTTAAICAPPCPCCVVYAPTAQHCSGCNCQISVEFFKKKQLFRRLLGGSQRYRTMLKATASRLQSSFGKRTVDPHGQSQPISAQPILEQIVTTQIRLPVAKRSGAPGASSLMEEMQAHYQVPCPSPAEIIAGLKRRCRRAPRSWSSRRTRPSWASLPSPIYPGPGLKPGIFLKELVS